MLRELSPEESVVGSGEAHDSPRAARPGALALEAGEMWDRFQFWLERTSISPILVIAGSPNRATRRCCFVFTVRSLLFPPFVLASDSPVATRARRRRTT